MSSGAVPCVILAGGKLKPDMAAAAGVENRALIPVKGRTMLACVVEALEAAPEIGRIVVVGDLPDSAAYVRVGDHGGFVENLFAGLAAAGDAEHALIGTCDVPFLTAESISDAVARGLALGVDVVYPAVPVAECYARFPGVKRTAVKLRDGALTGGNLMLVRVAFLEAHRERIAQAYGLRKSPLKLAAMFGLGTVLRLLISQTVAPSMLSVAQLEQAGSRMLGGTVRALISHYPEIATDIDRPSDLAAIS